MAERLLHHPQLVPPLTALDVWVPKVCRRECTEAPWILAAARCLLSTFSIDGTRCQHGTW